MILCLQDKEKATCASRRRERLNPREERDEERNRGVERKLLEETWRKRARRTRRTGGAHLQAEAVRSLSLLAPPGTRVPSGPRTEGDETEPTTPARRNRHSRASHRTTDNRRPRNAFTAKKRTASTRGRIQREDLMYGVALGSPFPPS